MFVQINKTFDIKYEADKRLLSDRKIGGLGDEKKNKRFYCK